MAVRSTAIPQTGELRQSSLGSTSQVGWLEALHRQSPLRMSAVAVDGLLLEFADVVCLCRVCSLGAACLELRAVPCREILQGRRPCS
jgi:hypothetical protein